MYTDAMGVFLTAVLWAFLVSPVLLVVVYRLRTRRQEPLDRAQDAFRWQPQDPAARQVIDEARTGVATTEIGGVQATLTREGHGDDGGSGGGLVW